jgi:hypothetical protein
MPLSEQDEAELKAAHRLYGRDTLVGRELFRIYNKGCVGARTRFRPRAHASASLDA